MLFNTLVKPKALRIPAQLEIQKLKLETTKYISALEKGKITL